jgi:two-component system cell cycle sensor histidine kinase/response regulator CckA
MSIDAAAALLADAAGSIVWEAVGEGVRYTYVSSRMERLLGYPAEQWLAEPDFWREHLHADDVARCVAAREAAVRDLAGSEIEYRMMAADGRAVWLRDVMRATRDADGASRLTGVTVDVSEAKLAENALRRTELRMQIMLHATSDAVWDWDINAGTMWWNEGLSTLFGYDPEEIDTSLEWWSARIHPEDRGPVNASLDAALEGSVVDWRAEYRFERADGAYAYVLDRGRIIRDVDGTARRMIGALVDLTSRRQSEEALRASEARFATAFGASPYPIVITDVETGAIVDANDALLKGAGYHRDEIIGRSVIDLGVWPSGEARDRVVAELTSSGIVRDLETVMRTKSGEPRIVLLSAGVVEIDGRPCIIGALSDITERKRIENRLHLLERAVEAVREGVVITTGGARGHEIIYTNPAFERLTGYREEEMLGRNCRVLQGDGTDPATVEKIRVALDGEREFSGEILNYHADGTPFWNALSISPIRDAAGAVTHFVGVQTDVTERRASEEAHFEREERLARQNRALRALTRRETVFFHDFAAAVREVTETSAEALGVERVSVWLLDADRQTMRAVDLYEMGAARHSSDHVLDAKACPAYFAALETEPVISASDAVADPRTREFANGYLEEHGISSMLDAGLLLGGRVAGVLCYEHVGPAREWSLDEQTFAAATAGLISIALEASERTEVEQALRESEERYRIVAETATDAILTIDERSTILFANSATEAVFGYPPEQLVGGELAMLIPEASNHLLTGTGALGPRRLELRGLHRSGAEIPIEVSFGEYRRGGRHLFTGIVRDVSERRMLEDQLRQAQRMEAVGRLAGGVAHDFNNLLTVITGFGDLALRQLRPGDPMRPDLEEVVRAGERAASLTRQLLAFSRRQMLEPRVLDLNAVVIDLNRMLERLIGEDVELVLRLDESLRSVRADPGQIEQVIANLAVNARDAMPEGGTLTVTTSVVELGAHTARARGLEGAGEYVSLSVSDTGVGMDAETLTHIFEPFFTTKEVGKGTGLGLATVYGIVIQSGGALVVESEPNRGTTFTIFLPAYEGQVEARESTAFESRVPRGSETILVAEDERSVRKLATEVLKSAGYRVLEAENAGDALLVSEAYDGPIDLLLTDVVMPKMSGRKLAERLVSERPSMKVLYMSGYTEDAILQHGVSEERTAFLPKPFAPEELGRRVREVLDDIRADRGSDRAG